VKRMKELNRFETKDAFDGEMRKLASLRHDNVLPPLAYHYRQGEKLVVYEYIPKGSLNYLLHGKNRILVKWWINSIFLFIIINITSALLEYIIFRI